MRPIKLSQRLGSIAAYIGQGASVADIGTGHGYLPVYLAQTGIARNIIASDASERSLEAAVRSAEKYGVENKIAFIAAPGLSGLGENEVDSIIIAGMGGETIIKILAGAAWVKRGEIRLILQPQTKIDKLRSWLGENGYIIRETMQVFDKGRLYSIILAHGKPNQASEIKSPVFASQE